ncbi:MAG TPA: zinc-dependent peptidase, partial [Gemmataceae bacterium]|nr:zinc-dependent peptidase [Gemmataceae bacterium]
AEYKALVRAVNAGHETLLGEDAAIDEREFFAVASEVFFTLPADLQELHPELYQLLADFYQLEPTMWFRQAKRQADPH